MSERGRKRKVETSAQNHAPSGTSTDVGPRQERKLKGIDASHRRGSLELLGEPQFSTPLAIPPIKAKRKSVECTPAEVLLIRMQEVAEFAAREAGQIIKKHLGSAKVEKTKSQYQDLATAVDSQCEEVIRSIVRRHFPTHSFLGEESVAPGTNASVAALKEVVASDYLWVVDPIDGTTNFVHGLPACVVSIGVACKGEVLVGVVYDPCREELFSAIKGNGLTVNGEVATVDRSVSLKSSVLAWGCPAHLVEPMFFAAKALGSRARALRNFGSASLHMAWVASGRLSGFYQLDLHAWDVAAGALLVIEGGGTVTDWGGLAYTLSTRDIAASNSAIHKEFQQYLTPALEVRIAHSGQGQRGEKKREDKGERAVDRVDSFNGKSVTEISQGSKMVSESQREGSKSQISQGVADV